MNRTLLISLFAVFAVAAEAQLTLPFAGTDPSATISAFQITKSGANGRANTLYITNAGNASEALFASTAGLGKAGLFTINNAANATQAIRGESNGSGVGIFGYMTGSGKAGSFRITNAANTTAALHAQTNGSGPAFLAQAGSGMAASFQGDVEVTSGGKLSIGAGTPVFPLDFSEALGDKVSLWGNNPAQHYGFGIQSGVLQIFSDSVGSDIAIGYGGSGSMTERVRFTGTAEMKMRPNDLDSSSTISSPYDMFMSHDRDDDNSFSWFRVFVNNGSIEQMRINDGDEATAFFDGAVTANGIDFAEAFKVADASLEPGDLVVNHGTDWQYITRSRGAYDQGVIGVVSTKPAFVAGMSFNAEDNMDPDLTRRRDEARRNHDEKLEKKLTMQMRDLVKQAYRPVAFMGRVPVKVLGPVKMGDHLTASNLPGVAMSMNKAGQSVGIALESNESGFGKIMVMVQPGFYVPYAANQGGERGTNDKQLQAKMERVLAENAGLRTELSDLRSRMERMERSLSNR